MVGLRGMRSLLAKVRTWKKQPVTGDALILGPRHEHKLITPS